MLRNEWQAPTRLVIALKSEIRERANELEAAERRLADIEASQSALNANGAES
jgi:hypothetical protein